MQKTSLVIAIDGPSASGKGSVAEKIAAHFNLPYLNTGALYRIVALRAIEKKIDLQNFENFIPDLVKNISQNDLENLQLFSEEVGSVASQIAKNKNLRAALLDFQKDFVKNGKEKSDGCVLDGRDTTTVICQDADYKFFVTADVEIRAKRRFLQLQNRGEKISFDEILSHLKQRDENDTNRKDAPLLIAKDAIIIDNSNITAEETFQKMLNYIKKS